MKKFLKLYKSPERTKWLGWIETARGRTVAYIRLSGEIVPWGNGIKR